jgi:hypothetical protein
MRRENQTHHLATWAMRYIVVDTGKWWIGHQVLITPQ